MRCPADPNLLGFTGDTETVFIHPARRVIIQDNRPSSSPLWGSDIATRIGYRGIAAGVAHGRKGLDYIIVDGSGLTARVTARRLRAEVNVRDVHASVGDQVAEIGREKRRLCGAKVTAAQQNS
jgi:hypothetical protein